MATDLADISTQYIRIYRGDISGYRPDMSGYIGSIYLVPKNRMSVGGNPDIYRPDISGYIRSIYRGGLLGGGLGVLLECFGVVFVCCFA